MKIPLSWLKDYVPIPKVSELEEKLRMSGTEIERVTHPPKLSGVVVGRVLKVKKHPGADKLKVCEVDTGRKFGRRTIVCGAVNVKAGQYVAVALPGAELGSGMTIKETKIRGIESAGMILSEDEIGLSSDEQHGILVIEKHPLGAPFEKLSGADTILEAEITPNRADELGMIGIAREVSVLFKKKLNLPKPKVRPGKINISKKLAVTVKDQKDCPRYTAMVLSVKSIKESPRWLKDRLKNAGYRPINLVVDITNFVLHEYGQPIHAFDLDKIAGRKIVVRRARAGERITTLDGVERRLDRSILVIADEKRPLAIAGVMGALESSVTAKTRNIVIESANFDPLLVRRGAKYQGLRTDAVTRFEKGLPREITADAAMRTASLIQSMNGAQVLDGMLDVTSERKNRTVLLDMDYVSDILGAKIRQEEAAGILRALSFKPISSEGNVIEFEIPTFRGDVKAAEDLVEEIARIRGYDSFPNLLPSGRMPKNASNSSFEFEKSVKQTLASLGFSEAVTFSFIPKDRAREFGTPVNEHIALTNPLSAENELLRTELLSSLVPVAAENLKHRDRVLLFESANTYRRSGRKPDERKMVTAVLAGEEEGFKKLKGLLEGALTSLGAGGLSFTPARFNKSHPTRGAKAAASGKVIGKIAELHPEFTVQWSGARIAYFEIDLEAVRAAVKGKTFSPPPTFPSISYDISALLKKGTTWSEVRSSIGEHDFLRKVEFLTSYKGKGIPKARRSVSVRLHFWADDRTLEESEVKGAVDEVVSRLTSERGAEIR